MTTQPAPDLSEFEIPIYPMAWSIRAPHTHGSWKAQTTPAGTVRWYCDGCHYTPPVEVTP